MQSQQHDIADSGHVIPKGDLRPSDVARKEGFAVHAHVQHLLALLHTCGMHIHCEAYLCRQHTCTLLFTQRITAAELVSIYPCLYVITSLGCKLLAGLSCCLLCTLISCCILVRFCITALLCCSLSAISGLTCSES